MTPIYTAFFTKGTLYEREAARLVGSLARLGLEHDVVGIDPIGGWVANSRYTATHIVNMMQKHAGRPIVQLDADAYVWRRPELFDAMDADVAYYRLPSGQLANGTVYLAPTAKAFELAEAYRRITESGRHRTDEQKCLDDALGEVGGLKVFPLPASYCFIHDINAGDLRGAVVIEHLQASREQGRSQALDRRRSRIAVVESGFVDPAGKAPDLPVDGSAAQADVPVRHDPRSRDRREEGRAGQPAPAARRGDRAVAR